MVKIIVPLVGAVVGFLIGVIGSLPPPAER